MSLQEKQVKWPVSAQLFLLNLSCFCHFLSTSNTVYTKLKLHTTKLALFQQVRCEQTIIYQARKWNAVSTWTSPASFYSQTDLFPSFAYLVWSSQQVKEPNQEDHLPFRSAHTQHNNTTQQHGIKYNNSSCRSGTMYTNKLQPSASKILSVCIKRLTVLYFYF